MLILLQHADLLGAQMRCISEPDKGSTFQLIVPLEVAPDHAKASLLTNDNHEHSLSRDLGLVLRLDELQKSTTDLPESVLGIGGDLEMRRHSIEDKNILIVEDNWTHQVVMQKMISMLGSKTKIAVNGEDALTLLKKGTFFPDIILMDIHLPMMVTTNIKIELPYIYLLIVLLCFKRMDLKLRGEFDKILD